MDYKEYKSTYDKYYCNNHLVKHASPCHEAFVQSHVHEFEGSTQLAESGEERHNHRFAGVSGEAIPSEGSHIHKVHTNTDFFDHFHEICILTGPAVNVGHGKHVHPAAGDTTFVDGHLHHFIFATLIESPLIGK